MIPEEPSFYITGGTLPPDAPSYIHRQADDRLYASLARGEFCYVLTSRQMGKSSLMVRTAARLAENGFRVVRLDLTSLGRNLTVEQWYRGILSHIGWQLGQEDALEACWQANNALGPLQRWIVTIEQALLRGSAAPLVVFVDEIDIVRGLPFSTDEFFAGIRDCYNRRALEPIYLRLTFCLLGVARPTDLIRDTRLTPFNIGRRIELSDFTPEEAAPLAPYAPEERSGNLHRILYWTGGQPYLTQRLCQAVAEGGRESHEVDELCKSLFLSPGSQERDDNLLFVRECLLKSDVGRAELLTLYGQILAGKKVRNEETDPRIEMLRLSGIVRVEGGYLRVRNRLYQQVFDREWIDLSMPDAERRRQQAAYRRGMIRAGAIGGMLMTLFGALALYALQSAVRANQNERKANEKSAALAHLLYVANMPTAQQAWEKNDVGAVRELLEQASDNQERGFEWNYLNRLCHLERQTFAGHTGPVTAVILSANGKYLITGSEDMTARIWDVRTGGVLHILRGHTGAITSAALSPDGQTLLTGSKDGAIRVWNTETGESEPTLRTQGSQVQCLALSPNGALVACGCGDGGVEVWNRKIGRKVWGKAAQTDRVGGIAFSPDGQWIASAGQDTLVQLWNPITGAPGVTLRHSMRLSSVVFTQDSRNVIAGSWDHQAIEWDIRTGQKIWTWPGKKSMISSLDVSPDNRCLLTGNADGQAYLWGIATQRDLCAYKGHAGEMRAVAFSTDGTQVVTGSQDGTAKLWNRQPASDVRELKGHTGEIWGVACFRDGHRMVTAGQDKAAIVWNIAAGTPLVRLQGHERRLNGVAISADDRMIVTASDDGTARIWNADNGMPLRTFYGHKGKVRCVAVSADGKHILTGGEDSTVRIWNSQTGAEIHCLKTPRPRVTAVAFSADGRSFAYSADDDFQIRIHDTATGRSITTLPEKEYTIYSIAFFDHDRQIATGSLDKTAKVWDIQSRQLLMTLRGHSDYVWSIAVSPDGKRIVTGSWDKTTRLWDVATGRTTLILREPERAEKRASEVYAVAISVDGKRIVAGGFDGVVRIWE